MENIESLRKDVLSLTNNIVKSILSRKKSVKLIQELKEQKIFFKNFDPTREVTVFEKVEELKSLSLKEVMCLSLMIESQAGSKDQYPQWSSGEHLSNKPIDISQQINPILLASTFKTRYDALPLNLEFKALLEKYMS
jgi:chorismate mutase